MIQENRRLTQGNKHRAAAVAPTLPKLWRAKAAGGARREPQGGDENRWTRGHGDDGTHGEDGNGRTRGPACAVSAAG
jgi:hypothetical protein